MREIVHIQYVARQGRDRRGRGSDPSVGRSERMRPERDANWEVAGLVVKQGRTVRQPSGCQVLGGYL